MKPPTGLRHCLVGFMDPKIVWLVVLTILNNISQWAGLSHI